MFTNMLRQPLLSLSRNESVKDALTSLSATRSMVANYVPGETVEDVVAASAGLVADGLNVTIDYLGEDVVEKDQALHVSEVYRELIGELAETGIAANGRAEVSVKPTALGLDLPDVGEELAAELLVDIVRAAHGVGTTVTVDMENHTVTDRTLNMVRRARSEFPSVGCVVQAYLHRTLADVERMTGDEARTRLCKGAYDEPDTVSFDSSHDIDKNYVKCLAALMARPGYPMVATHDPRLLAIAETLAAHHHRGDDDWEVQMLYGVRTDEQRRLAALGRTVRVYVPFGDDWYGYMVRRLAERPANIALFMRSLVGSS